MLRSIKYELDLNKTQKEFINKACGCCRLVYNTMLDRKIKEYQNNGISLSTFDLIKELVPLKNDKIFLKETPSQALQQTIINLGNAFDMFFKRGNKGFPKFHKKGRKDSFRIPESCDLDFSEWKVKLPKLGWVKIYRGHNKMVFDKILSYTITHTSTGRYIISILQEIPDKKKLNNGKTVGIDLGIKDFAVLSDGGVFENQKYLKQNLRKLRVLQRTASRRYQKGKKRDQQSENWKKAILRVSKLHEHIAFQRNDMLHKISTWISRNYSTVCIESLSIKKMMGNSLLSREISDVAWGKFIEMLKYKCDQVVEIDQFFASSQTCFDCGYKNTNVKDLSVREWTCPQCGTIHNRDLNAARNIEREGLSLCGLKVSGNTMLVPRTLRIHS